MCIRACPDDLHVCLVVGVLPALISSALIPMGSLRKKRHICCPVLIDTDTLIINEQNCCQHNRANLILFNH